MILHGPGRADHAAPVMHDERDWALGDGAANERIEVIDALRECVAIEVIAGLVGEAHPDVIGDDAPMRLAQRAHDIAVVERPRWVAVHHHDCALGIARALIEVVHLHAIGEREELAFEGIERARDPKRVATLHARSSAHQTISAMATLMPLPMPIRPMR